MKTNLPTLILLTLAACGAPTIRAHDIWLLPDQFSVKAGRSVRLTQNAGHRLEVEQQLPLLQGVTTRFELITVDGVRDLLEEGGGDRAMPRVRLAGEGVALLVMEHGFAQTELPREIFRGYVEEEGLVEVQQLLSEQPARKVERERYVRSMQVLVRAGGARDRYPAIEDGDLRFLEGLERLQGLDLRGNPVTDQGLAHLAGLSGLRRLDLSGTRVTDAGLARLGRLSSLRELRLAGTGITAAGLKALSPLARLERLDLRDTAVTEVGPVDGRATRIELGARKQSPASLPTLNLLPPRVDLQLLDNPFLLDPGDLLRVRASIDGLPLAGQAIGAYRGDGKRLVGSVEARTDAEGVAGLQLDAPGVWMARFVYMQQAAPGSGVDWESYWACFMFEID